MRVLSTHPEEHEAAVSAMLEYPISDRTVGNILKAHGIEPGATRRHAALLLPASGLTFQFKSDLARRAASQHEVCPGDGSRFHYQAQQGTSCPSAERFLSSTRLLSAEIAAHCRLLLVT